MRWGSFVVLKVEMFSFAFQDCCFSFLDLFPSDFSLLRCYVAQVFLFFICNHFKASYSTVFLTIMSFIVLISRLLGFFLTMLLMILIDDICSVPKGNSSSIFPFPAPIPNQKRWAEREGEKVLDPNFCLKSVTMKQTIGLWLCFFQAKA